MPFVKRVVEPRHLSRRPLPDGVCRQHDELQEALTNSTLTQALRQLSCIARIAEDIFADLSGQLSVIGQRAERAGQRIDRLDEIAIALNAKEVAVPVGNLDQFCRLKEHYVRGGGEAATSDGSKCLFTVGTRPAFVGRLYEAAVASPVRVIRQTDGSRSSKYFLCLPFFKDDGKLKFDVEIEMRKPASLLGARDWLSNDDTLDSIVGPLHVQHQQQLTSDGESSSGAEGSTTPTPDSDSGFDQLLPTPEEQTYVMSLKYPYSDVPIDVTGTGFKRMLTLRRSFIQQMESFAKRKKRGRRHNTVTGQNDVEAALKASNRALKKSSTGTQTSCPKLNTERSGSAASGTSSSTSSSGQQLRSCSSDPAGSRDKLRGASGNSTTTTTHRASIHATASGSSEPCRKESSSSTSGLHKWFQRRGRNRSSIIGGLGVCEELDRVKKSRRSLLGNLLSLSSPATSDASPSKSSTDSAMVTGASSESGSGRVTYRQASLRRPGKQHAAHHQHRSSLPIPTGAVRMRESSARGGATKKGGQEDAGQSSSGNWSASSSTRTSMESSEEPAAEEEAITPVSPSPDLLDRTGGSQASLSKDSALSDRTTPNEELRWHESSNGYHSDSTYSSSQPASSQRWPGTSNNNSSNNKRSIKSDTARWLRSLEEESGASGGTTAGLGSGLSGATRGETTDAASSTGTITPRVHRRHRTRSPPDSAGAGFGDDGESSEFSVDCDGYYTSMHSDSGLRTLPIAPAPGHHHHHHHHRKSHNQDDSAASALGKFSRLSDLLEHGSTSTLSSSDTNADESLKSMTVPVVDPPEVGSKRKVPPPPPPRRSTLVAAAAKPETAEKSPKIVSESDSSVSVAAGSDDTSSSSGSSKTASDDSEEGAEQVETFRRKCSLVGPGRIPSLCVVTPSASDDEEESVSGLDSASTSRAQSWMAHPQTYASLPRSSELQKRSWLHDGPGWNGTALDQTASTSTTTDNSRTLPRCLDRYASFGAGTSERRPTTGQTTVTPTYQPTVLPLRKSPSPSDPAKLDQQQPRSTATTVAAPVSPARRVATGPMTSFTQPLATAGSTIRTTATTPYVHSARYPFPPEISSDSGATTSGVRQGARVTLDPAGQVVRSTSGTAIAIRPQSTLSSSHQQQLLPSKVVPNVRPVATATNLTGGAIRPVHTTISPSVSTSQHPDSIRASLSHIPIARFTPSPAQTATQGQTSPQGQISTQGLVSPVGESSSTLKNRSGSNCNTFPRWKPSSHSDRIASTISGSPTTTATATSPPSGNRGYPSGSLPRRWNNFSFLRKDGLTTSATLGAAASDNISSTLTHTPSPPDSLASAKTGAYVRLDGHHSNLEPGILSKSSPGSSQSTPGSGSMSPGTTSSTSIDEIPAMPLLQQHSYSSSSRLQSTSSSAPTSPFALQATPPPVSTSLFVDSCRTTPTLLLPPPTPPSTSTTTNHTSPSPTVANRPPPSSIPTTTATLLPNYYRPVDRMATSSSTILSTAQSPASDYAKLRLAARESAYGMPTTGYGRAPSSPSHHADTATNPSSSRIPISSSNSSSSSSINQSPTYLVGPPPQYRQPPGATVPSPARLTATNGIGPAAAQVASLVNGTIAGYDRNKAVNVNGLPASPAAVLQSPQQSSAYGPRSSTGGTSPAYSTPVFVYPPTGLPPHNVVYRQPCASEPRRPQQPLAGQSDHHGRPPPTHASITTNTTSSTTPAQRTPHTPGTRSPALGATMQNGHGPAAIQSTTAKSTVEPPSYHSPATTPITTSNRTPIISPPSPTAPPSVSVNQQQQQPATKKASTMSAEDLYALIHKSKRKMNIRTELDRSVSPTSSSRSSNSSPSGSNLQLNNLTSTPAAKSTRGYQVESGVLSPRSHSPLNLPGDRRSWSGDRGSSSPAPLTSPGDRRSWASDRLGPAKPTSLKNFKMLLLAANRSTPNSTSNDGRRSAAELLRSPTTSTNTATPPPVSVYSTSGSGGSSVAASPQHLRSPSGSPADYSRSNHGRQSPQLQSNHYQVTPMTNGSSSQFSFESPPQRVSQPRIHLFNSRLQAQQAHHRGSRAANAVLHSRTDVLSTPIMEDECSDDEEEEDDGREGQFVADRRPAWNYGPGLTPVTNQHQQLQHQAHSAVAKQLFTATTC